MRRFALPLAALLLLGRAPTPAASQTPPDDPGAGDYEPGIGFVVAQGDQGRLAISLWTYLRYLNQKSLDATYTDAFGRTAAIDRRQDIQHQKATLYFRGWIFDPRLLYQAFIWTANTNQGTPSQLAVSGYLAWDFGPRLLLSGGVTSLPSTRSTQGIFPSFLKVDHRTIADEFFRASYTFGVWAKGAVADGLEYQVMLGDNLSILGVDAGQLDDGLNTASAALWWMPTTGEFGPQAGYGDFEHHERLATLVGLRYTRSREDSQSQPDPEAIENSQLRLSDGTNLFAAGAFAPGAQVRRATYRMLSADAGLKLRGFSLDGEYFARWLDDFTTVGDVPVSSLFDQGFQLQASAMAVPRTLQLYVAGSRVFGDYGDPWDLSGGLNYFPLGTKHFRVNGQALYLVDSPVGYLSVPFPLGGNGTVFTLDAELLF